MTEHDWLTSTDPAAMLHHLQYATHEEPSYGGTTTQSRYPPLISPRKLRLFACACCRAVCPLLTDDVMCGRCLGVGQQTVWKQYSLEMKKTTTRSCPDCGGTGRVNRSRRAVETAERYADGEITKTELMHACQDAIACASRVDPYDVSGKTPQSEASKRAWLAVWPANDPDNVLRNTPGYLRRNVQDQAGAASLLREIVGNPCRPLDLVDVCDTSTRDFFDARAVAHAIYAGRHFEDMPVLADALEEAGCTDGAVLRHLRGWERCPVCGGRGTVRYKEPSGHGDTDTVLCGQCNPDRETRIRGIQGPNCGWIRLRAPHVRGCWAADAVLGKESVG